LKSFKNYTGGIQIMATAGNDLDPNVEYAVDDENRTPGQNNTIHQEVVIDIHVRHLKLQIDEIMN